MEHLQTHSDAVSEFYKLKQRLILTDEEQEALKQMRKIEYKRCCKCGEVLPTTAFYKNPLKSKGVFDYCKACACLMAMQRRKSKKEREREAMEAFRIMSRNLGDRK